jgi:hypothetical protein
MNTRPPFEDEARRREFLRRFNQIHGVNMPDDVITRRPQIELVDLRDENILQQFLAVLDWAVEEIRKS